MLSCHNVQLYRVLDTVVTSGEDVCYSVVFGTLVGVSVFSVIWSELLMTSAISCPLYTSVYECQRVECAIISPVRTECAMFVMCCMQYCISVSIECVDVLSRGGISMLAIVICFVLLICTITI